MSIDDISQIGWSVDEVTVGKPDRAGPVVKILSDDTCRTISDCGLSGLVEASIPLKSMTS
jgi:hypothetical protein